MSLTSDGLKIKRYSEVLEDLNTGLKERLGSSVNTSETSLLGHLHSNLSLKLAELWELTQAVYDSGSLLNAEGAALDNLALNFGIVRSPVTQSQGIAWFTGDNGTVIEEGSKVASLIGDEFSVQRDFSISTASCLQTKMFVSIVADTQEYKVSLDGFDYTYTSDADATHTEILQGLETQLALDGNVTLTFVQDVDDDSKSYLLIDKNDKDTTIAISGTSYLTFQDVVTPALIKSEEFGPIPGDSLSIQVIIDGVTGWSAVSNFDDITLGEEQEDDNDLRSRILSDFNTVGSGTVDSIISNVKKVDGVTAVIVKENTTTATVDGIPPKSYEVIVDGGLNQEVGQAIWDTKPAGILAHGDTTVNLTDFNGYSKQVKFTRPTTQFIYIDVTYSPYAEEDLPAGGIDSAKTAMYEYALANFTIDKDVHAKRFLGPMYGATSGLGDVTITVASSTDTAIPPLAGAYTDTIAISDNEVPSFAVSRISIHT